MGLHPTAAHLLLTLDGIVTTANALIDLPDTHFSVYYVHTGGDVRLITRNEIESIKLIYPQFGNLQLPPRHWEICEIQRKDLNYYYFFFFRNNIQCACAIGRFSSLIRQFMLMRRRKEVHEDSDCAQSAAYSA